MASQTVLILCCLLLPLIQHSKGVVDLCGSLSSWPVPEPPKDTTLKQVISVIRHGDRTTWDGGSCWPGDNAVWDCNFTHAEIPTYWPTQYRDRPVPMLFEKIYLKTNEVMNGNCSVAQLTAIGYSQHLANGRSLNTAYVKKGFLKSTLDPSEVFIRSDDMPRTLESAQSLILGMFQMNSTQNSRVIPFIPIYTRDLKYSDLKPNSDLCAKFGSYSDQFKTSKIWQEHASMTKGLFANLSKVIGYEVKSGDSLNRVCDCLTTHKCHDLSWPKAMTEDLYAAAWKELSWEFYSLYKYPSIEENTRVGIGFLLKEIWKKLNSSVNGDKVEKFLLYSGHDTTLMPMLAALQVDNGEWAPYASMILIELYETSKKKHVVRFIYNGKVLNPPFCDDGMCQYDVLSEHLHNLTPPDDYANTICKPDKL